jgi:GGDEF domain-containing protein
MIIDRVIQAEDVIARCVGDEMVVLKFNADFAHVLNTTAAAIWELCDGKHSLDEIANRICERFEVSFEQAREDIEQIIGRFIKVGIVNGSVAPSIGKEESQTF